MKDSTAFASRIAEAVDEHKKTHQMCRAGREQVENQHSLGTMLDRLSDLHTSQTN
jgi:hypothetical protein